MRSSRHEPTTELERHALRIELPFDEPCRRSTRLPGVRWHATELPLRLLHTGMQATGVSCAPTNVAQHRRYGHPALGTPTPAVAGGAYRLRVFAVWRACPRRAPLRRLQCVRAFDRTRRQLSGLRHRHPARRSACIGGDDPILISDAVASGDGHDALLAQGLDNPCGGSPHDHTRHYDDGPSGLETRVL
jgi:hypothetical protein